MSVEKDSNTEISTVYVNLLDEGTPVIRPTKAAHLQDDIYKLLPPEKGYTPNDEKWEFPLGAKVICQIEERDGDNILVAKRLA